MLNAPILDTSFNMVHCSWFCTRWCSTTSIFYLALLKIIVPEDAYYFFVYASTLFPDREWMNCWSKLLVFSLYMWFVLANDDSLEDVYTQVRFEAQSRVGDRDRSPMVHHLFW